MGLEHICKQILTHRTEGRSSVECSVSLRYDQHILQLGQWPNSWIQWRNSAFFLKLLHTTSGILSVAPTSFISLHIHHAVIYKAYTGLTSNSIQFIPRSVKIAQLVDLKTTGLTRTRSELHTLTPTLMEWQHADFVSRLFYDAASVSYYTVLMVEGRWMIKWQEFGRWWWSLAHQCTIPALCWRDWGRPQEASIRTVPWPTVKLDILQGQVNTVQRSVLFTSHLQTREQKLQ